VCLQEARCAVAALASSPVAQAGAVVVRALTRKRPSTPAQVHHRCAQRSQALPAWRWQSLRGFAADAARLVTVALSHHRAHALPPAPAAGPRPGAHAASARHGRAAPAAARACTARARRRAQAPDPARTPHLGAAAGAAPAAERACTARGQHPGQGWRRTAACSAPPALPAAVPAAHTAPAARSRPPAARGSARRGAHQCQTRTGSHLRRAPSAPHTSKGNGARRLGHQVWHFLTVCAL